MRRRLLGGIVLLAAVAAAGWWFARPTPGESLFADWQPRVKGKVWTITGSPGSSHLVFVGPNGAFQPGRDSYAIHYFIYDRDRHRLCSGSSHALLVREIVPTSLLECRGIDVSCQTFIASDETRISVASVANKTPAPRRIAVFVVAVPYQLTGGMLGSPDVRYDSRSRSIAVGGSVLLYCDTRPAGGAAYAGDSESRAADITSYVRSGLLPRSAFARGGPRVVTSSALRFDVSLQPFGRAEIVLRSPVKNVSLAKWSRTPRAPVDDARDSFVRAWDDRLGRVSVQLPDRRYEMCFRASLAYLVMLSADGKPVPGPTRYNSLWVRDCAYMADALYYSGQQDLIPPALEHLRAMQLAGGGFPPRLGARIDDELDAPGEVIYALVGHYRRTNDKNWLANRWPCILAACRYVRAQRGAGSGILGPSVSAEDLGDKLQRHYWDDFWCIRGLRDAAFAARALGKRDDAAWISAEAESLHNATRASIEATMARHSIGYIPNGPDEVVSSSAARGTSCALWPCAALDPTDALVRRSYDVYWRKWIAPSGGGFIHRGHYWPYAGLDLAQGYLMLGQGIRAWSILKWTLDHDPTHGFFAWPEGMFIEDLSLAEGDMPHGWVCAAYISLVRNMLVRESGRDLVLLSGVPNEWLKPDSEIAIRDFPTEFGKVSYRAKASADGLKLTLSGARPRGCYRVILPGRSAVVVPSGAREITIRLGAARTHYSRHFERSEKSAVHSAGKADSSLRSE